jgi:peroxiredoxin Q/BCP
MSDPMDGKKIPAMTLAHSEGGQLAIPDDSIGKWTLLYFYPKDDTPGCTKQACSYRDNIDRFQELGVGVFGVSLDDLTSHDHFKTKFSLNFPLLADTKCELSQALGVFGEQEWAGQVFKGLSRDTFLIDNRGCIARVWRKVSPTETMDETYEAARALIQKG